MHQSDWERLLAAPSPSFAAFAQDPMLSLPTPNPSQATVDDFLSSVNLETLVASMAPGEKSATSLAAAAASSASLMSAMAAVTKLPALGKGNLLPVAGMPEAPSPFDNIFDEHEHAVPTAAAAAAGAFGMGPTSRAAAATAGLGAQHNQLVVPEQLATSAHVPARAAGARHTMEVDFSSFGVPTSPSPLGERYTSSASPSPSPPPPGNGDGGRGRGRGGPVRSGRPRRAAAVELSSSPPPPQTAYIPSASNPDDVAGALAELVALGLNVNAAPSKAYLMTALERHEVKMMSQLAWKLFFKPEMKATLTAADIRQVKKDRRRAKGTIYAQNSRRKQASEKHRTTDRITQLQLENDSLKVRVAQLSAQLLSRR